MNARLTLLVLLAAGFAPAQETGREDGRGRFDRYHRTVFFAVLEGAFEDGVADEDVDRMLATDPVTKDFRNFVYGCPICMPAMDALRTYRNRGDWPYKAPGPTNTFGPGLEPHLRRALAAEDKESQWKAVQTLLERWVTRRMDLLRMTAAEREDLSHALEDMRKRGMEVLQSSRAMGGAKRCAACDGANAALGR